MDACTAWCCFVTVFCLMFTWYPQSTHAQEEMLVAVGTSVLLSSPSQDTPGVVFWQLINGSETSPILDYYAHRQGRSIEDLSIHQLYEDRVEFFISNGSLLLKNVQVADSGVYKVTVDLNEVDARHFKLRVIGPVPPPLIRCNYSSAGSPVEISCDVPANSVANSVTTIVWKKGGASLPHDTCYHFKNQNHSVLHIPKAEKSDCTSFSCNVSNPFYWNESYYDLTFEGVMPAMLRARELSIASLVTALFSLLSFIIQFFQPKETFIIGEVWRWFTVYLQSLVCLSSLLLFIATIIWMTQKGSSGTFILLCILLVFVMVVTSGIVIILAFCPKKLKTKSDGVSRIILDSTAPGGVILIVLFSSFLIQDINKMQEEGCSAAPNRAAISIGLTFALLNVPAIFGWVFLWFHKRREDQGGGHPAEEEPGAEQQPEKVNLPLGTREAEEPGEEFADAPEPL